MSEGEYSEEELGSLAVNLGSLHHQSQGSDTEADFLDKVEIKNTSRDGRAAEEEYKNNIGDDELSLGSDLEHCRDKILTKVRGGFYSRRNFVISWPQTDALAVAFYLIILKCSVKVYNLFLLTDEYKCEQSILLCPGYFP